MSVSIKDIDGFIRTMDELKEFREKGYNYNIKEGNLNLLKNEKDNKLVIIVNGVNLTDDEKELCKQAYFELGYNKKDTQLLYRYYMPFMSEEYPYYFTEDEVYSFNTLSDKLNKDYELLDNIRTGLQVVEHCIDSADEHTISEESIMNTRIEANGYKDFFDFIKHKANDEQEYLYMIENGVKNKDLYQHNLLNPYLEDIERD